MVDLQYVQQFLVVISSSMHFFEMHLTRWGLVLPYSTRCPLHPMGHHQLPPVRVDLRQYNIVL